MRDSGSTSRARWAARSGGASISGRGDESYNSSAMAAARSLSTDNGISGPRAFILDMHMLVVPSAS